MPVRYLNSSVFKWPDLAQVKAVALEWAIKLAGQHPNILRVGYFGSYARGDWGVGSDLDLVVIVKQSREPFEQRALAWDLSELPVPAEVLVYTQAEWQQLQAKGGRFAQTLNTETIWLYPPANNALSPEDNL